MNKEVNKRVSKYLEFIGMNANSYAVALGVKPAIIYNIVGGRYSKPSFELIEKMSSFDISLDLNWLITGKGAMKKQGDSAEMENLKKENEYLKSEKEHLQKEVELIREMLTLYKKKDKNSLIKDILAGNKAHAKELSKNIELQKEPVKQASTIKQLK